MLIFKVVRVEEWPDAKEHGEYAGSHKDRADGFLHFSTLEQLPATLSRYYTGEKDLVLVAVESARLGHALKFEASTGGGLYPHLYAPLKVSTVEWTRALKRRPHGEFVLPI